MGNGEIVEKNYIKVELAGAYHFHLRSFVVIPFSSRFSFFHHATVTAEARGGKEEGETPLF